VSFCDRCGKEVKWITNDEGKWRLQDADGSYHKCDYALIIDMEVFDAMMNSCAESEQWMVRKLLERLIEHKAKYKTFDPLNVVEKFITEENPKKKKFMCYCKESMWKSRIFGYSKPSFVVDDDGVIQE
jgi:hypothetical protein